MPSVDDFDFDDFHESQPQPEPVDPVPVPPKKGKKKKRHVAQARARLDEEEDTPYAKSVTPSPPANYGVRLDTPPRPAQPPPEPELVDVPIAEAVEAPAESHPFAWDDNTTAVEEPGPPPKPPPPRSPPIRSPRPAAAKPASPAVSPTYRPASLYKPPQQYTSHSGYRPNSAAAQPTVPRRESFVAQARSPQPCPFDPPPPHMPQPHFFGLPDFGLSMMPKTENSKAAGSDGYCCRFDSFADGGDAASARRARDALLVGSECGLEVYRVLLDKMEVAGRLEGLRGAVIDAKVLPHTSIYDSAQVVRPLMAIIVHGPLNDEHNDAGEEDQDLQARATLYQTTVEVYSLQSQQHITTLYKSTTVKMEQPVVGHLSLPPKPVGELSLNAAGRFLTLASGKSGEILVFTCDLQSGERKPDFRCIAKYWTALQTRAEASRPTSASDGHTLSEWERQARIPLMSLSSRWLTMVPPYTSPGSSIQGSPKISETHPQPYGLGTHAAPLQPPLTCEVAGINAEGTISWLSRKAAQGLVTASQRGYEMSVQGWKELTHPSPPSAEQKSSQEPNIFPPNNAPADDLRRLAKEPALVSIIDLQRLLSAEEQRLKQAPGPLATFALVEGCNYVSFSSDGLRLLTSNRRGEVSSVWDLAHVGHGSMRPSSGDEAEAERVPHVKLMHRIARSSPSVIVDSVWSRDGDWVALLTAHGTVHLHEVPLTASGKRKRRPTVSVPASDKAESTVSLSQGVSPPSNGFLGSWRSWSQSVSTQVNAVKSQYALPTTFAGFRETAASARTAGQRAVAKGISQGYIAAKSGASDIWHAEDNKIRLKLPPEGGARVGSMRWVQRQGSAGLAVACGGSVYLHPVQRVTRQKGDAMVSGLKKDKHAKNFPLPRISTSRDGAGAKGNSCVKEGPHGFWSLRIAPMDDGKGAGRPVAGRPVAGPLATSANEVETNPPYCPFHVDRRVNIYAFEDSTYASQFNLHAQPNEDAMSALKDRGQHYGEDEEPWVFGEPLPASNKLNERTYEDLAGRAGSVNPASDDLVGMIESRLTIHPAGEGDGQDIRVNSRRSRRAGRQEQVEEAGFELMEDDDSLM